MKICEEMTKLRKYLDDNDIAWVDSSNPKDCGMYKTQFYINDIWFSVIYGYGTYGGYDVLGCKDYGLLELMSDVVPASNHVSGWLTADNIVEYIKCAEVKNK